MTDFTLGVEQWSTQAKFHLDPCQYGTPEPEF